MTETMHLGLKFNDNIYNVNTIKEHKKVIEEQGNVIWGIIKPSVDSPRIAESRVLNIRSQLENGDTIYAYIATNGSVVARATVNGVLNTMEVKERRELVPQYYHKDLDRCLAGIIFSKLDWIDSNVVENLKRYGTDDGKVAWGNQTNPLYVAHKSRLINSKGADIAEKKEGKENEMIVLESLKHIYNYIRTRGFIISFEDLCNFYLSLKTKPLVILAGISGTGKSRLVRLFAEAVGALPNNGQYRIISIKPDWNDSSDLFGYKDFNQKFVPGSLFLTVFEASKPENKNKPYFLCLDEMNLARVEYYLSDYLSISETRKRQGKQIVTETLLPKGYLTEEDVYATLSIPDNLYLIGTVNMDDTTFAFSRKVLDRTNTIEFSEVRLEELDFPKSKPMPIEKGNDFLKTGYLSLQEALNKDDSYVMEVNSIIIHVNNILAETNLQFGYRVRDEIVYYMLEARINNLLDQDMAMDYQILQKVLPPLSGSDYYLKSALIQLYNFCNPEGQISDDMNYITRASENLGTARYMNSAKKIIYMLRGHENGYVSYW